MKIQIAQARPIDAPRLAALVNQHAEKDVMLFRTPEEIVAAVDNWVVAEKLDAESGTRSVLGGGCLTELTPELAEVRSLVMDVNHQGYGLGQRIVRRIEAMARERGFQQLCALTLVPEFFLKLGFRSVDVAHISPKVWVDCVHCAKYECCNEYALILDLVPNPVLPDYSRMQAPLPKKDPAWIPLEELLVAS